jgi:low temperature requirement protein LtrA
LFACAYVFMHVGRTIFFLWAVRKEPQNKRRNFQRILVWLMLTGSLWICGGCLEGTSRVTLWTLALGLELIAPSLYYWVPGLGASVIGDWDIDGSHMAERCSLFVIIALGESLLVTGATFAEAPWNGATIVAFLVGVLGTIAMWWLYFDSGAERANDRIKAAADPGRQARLAYTYLHVLIVGGVIVCAVADEIALAHPGHASDAGIAAILGGPAMYLFANALFKWVTNDRPTPPLSHMAGIVLLAIVAPFAHSLSAVALASTTTAILIVVATWETIALHRPAGATPGRATS